MRELFEEFGPVVDVVMKQRFAFVEFESVKDVQKAIQKTNGSIECRGERLTVEEPRKFLVNSDLYV